MAQQVLDYHRKVRKGKKRLLIAGIAAIALATTAYVGWGVARTNYYYGHYKNAMVQANDPTNPKEFRESCKRYGESELEKINSETVFMPWKNRECKSGKCWISY